MTRRLRARVSPPRRRAACGTRGDKVTSIRGATSAAPPQSIMRKRLDVLYVTLFPASPARYGAQRRLQGIMESLARRHSITAVSLITPDLDAREAEQAMRAYCEDVILVPSHPWEGPAKRVRQLRALFSL